MSGRPPVKGERPWYGMVDPEGVHRRTIRALVDSVALSDGYVTLDFDGLPSVGRPATIPWLWASFPTPGQGAWGRYIPFPGDVMKVSFNYDDTPEVVGYDTKAESPETSDGKTGWPKLKKANISGSLPMFRPLKSGEFDFMSIGGAYVFGSASGQLMLAAGPATIVLTQSSNSLRSEATQYTLASTTNTIRYGQVRRALPGFPGEVAGNELLPNPSAVWNPDGTLAEFQVQINKTVGGVGLPMARIAMGSVTSEAGVQEVGTNVTGLRRFVVNVKDVAGVQDLASIEIDNAGNVAATSLTGQIAIIAQHIQLGTAPTGGVMNGTVFGSAMNIANNTLAAALTTAGGLATPTAQIAGIISALNSWITAFNNASRDATSSVVQVT